MERLVERAMTFAVEEYDDDRAVARLAWLARDDLVALDQACDRCLSYTDLDLGIRGRTIGLLARVLYPDLPPAVRAACGGNLRLTGCHSGWAVGLRPPATGS